MSASEIAIGVRYVPGDPAPKILFKARGYQAKRVKELATKWGIAHTEAPDLAPLLFQLPEGSWIPEKHFVVLAQLLSAVYHYNQKAYDKKNAPRQ